MCSGRSLRLFLAVAFAIFLGPPIGKAQSSKPSYETSFSHSDILLRRVVVKHPGCITCSDTILKAEEAYVRRRVGGGADVVFSLDQLHDQKEVNHAREVLQDFWKERGIAVEVSANLTPGTNASRGAVLEFNVCGKY